MSDGGLVQKKYKPEHPLPKELQEMKRDETICQFCGVSYLIHNEIKKLEEEIEKLKSQLKTFEGFDEREIKLRRLLEEKNKKLENLTDELRNEKLRNDELNINLDQMTKSFETQKEEKNVLQSSLRKMENELDEKIKQLKSFSLLLQSSWVELKHIKENLNEIQIDQGSLQSSIKAHLPNLQNHFAKLKNKIHEEEQELKHHNDQMKKQLRNAERQMETMQEKLQDATEQSVLVRNLKENIETVQLQLESYKEENAKLKSDNIARHDAVEKMKNFIDEKSNRIKILESEIEEKNSLFQAMKQEYEKSVEKNNKNLEAANRRCHQYKNDIETLKKSRNEEEENMASNLIQIKILKEGLDKANLETSALKKEREDMIEAHQNRIRQLRESFQEKLLEVNSLPKQLEEKLAEQQQRFNEERNKLWQELNNSFQQELNNMKNKHEMKIEQLEKENRKKNSQLKDQLETLQRRSREEIENLKTGITHEKEKSLRMTVEAESLAHKLLAKINALESEVAILHKKASCDDGVYKQRFFEASRALELAQTELEHVEGKLKQSDQEIDVLRETVRRECEERFELTEALSEARLKLLTSLHSSKVNTPPRTASKEIMPSSPSVPCDVGNREQRKLKANKNSYDKLKPLTDSSQCFASKENGIAALKLRDSVEQNYNRKRITEAISVQRMTRKGSFDQQI